jgi:low affinity Fe/Cu permease
MNHGHISDVNRATKAFRERVYYWRKKGLSEDDAVTRASQSLSKRHLKSVKSDENLEARKPGSQKTWKPENLDDQELPQSPPPPPIIAAHEPSQEEVDWEIERLLRSGSVTLVGDGQAKVLPFKKPENLETRKSGSGDHLAFLVRLVLPVTCTLAASGLLMMKTAAALGGSHEAWVQAVLIEVGITCLSLRRATSVWSFLAYRMAALALVCLSVFLLQTSSLREHAAKVHQVVTSNDRVTDLVGIKESLTAQLAALPVSYVTKREQLTADLKRIADELAIIKKETREGGEVSVLNQVYLAESLIRLALVALSIFFAHQARELLESRRAVIEPA